MFSSISESLFGANGNGPSPDKKNVNMAPRSAKKSSKSERAGERGGTEEDQRDQQDYMIEQLKNQLQLKTASVLALSSKVERLEDSTQSDLKAVVKRRHHPVITEVKPTISMPYAIYVY
jgi:molecular chaperone GrpE (heat shock protein)